MKLREFYSRFASFALGMSPQEAYELQRTLQMDERAASAGLKAGRSGPGGGAEATPFTVTFMMLGAMIDGPKNTAIQAVWDAFHYPQEGFKGEMGEKMPECPLTRQGLFGEALKFLLSSPVHASAVDRVEVVRAAGAASIYFRDDTGLRRSLFLHEYDRHRLERIETQGAMHVVAVIGGEALKQIACDLRAVTPQQ